MVEQQVPPLRAMRSGQDDKVVEKSDASDRGGFNNFVIPAGAHSTERRDLLFYHNTRTQSILDSTAIISE